MNLHEARQAATKIATTLKRMAKADDRTMAEIAAKCGISTTVFYSWQHSHRSPKLRTVIMLADVLGYELVLRKKRTRPNDLGTSALPHAADNEEADTARP